MEKNTAELSLRFVFTLGSPASGMKMGNGHSGRVAETNAITIYIAFYLVQFLS